MDQVYHTISYQMLSKLIEDVISIDIPILFMLETTSVMMVELQEWK